MFKHSEQRAKPDRDILLLEAVLKIYNFMEVGGYGFNSNLDQTLDIHMYQAELPKYILLFQNIPLALASLGGLNAISF